MNDIIYKKQILAASIVHGTKKALHGFLYTSSCIVLPYLHHYHMLDHESNLIIYLGIK